MNVRSLKEYSFEETLYLKVFDISKEELKDRPLNEIIKDYEHLHENVEEALGTLTKREVSILRYVLGDKMTLKAVSELFCVNSDRVRQILAKAYRKLRTPCRTRTLDGTRRLAQIEQDAQEERVAEIRARWEDTRSSIQNRVGMLREQRLRDVGDLSIETLALSTECIQKMQKQGIRTVRELLNRCPYNTVTNCLDGLTLVPGVDDDDYREIWLMLWSLDLLVREPELPDIEKQRKVEDMSVDHFEDIKLDEMELSARTYNCLKWHWCQTVGDIIQAINERIPCDLAFGPEAFETTEKAIDMVPVLLKSRIRNFGVKSAEELALKLHELYSTYVNNGRS